MHQRILIILTAILLAAGCSPGGSDSPLSQVTPSGPGIQPPAGLIAATAPDSIAEQIRSVSEAPVPDEVDPVIFEELRAQLIRVLATKSVAVPDPTAVPPPPQSFPKMSSFTPYGMVNEIRDLYVSGTGPHYLTWTYRNKGDYDLNGMVNVSDLTPVGIYYGMTSSDPLWLKAAAADGDGNGMITVSDITPLGQFFGGTITGYQVWGTNTPSAEWQYVGNATVETNLRKNPTHPRIVIQFETLDYDYYSLWPYDGSEDEGWWSNIATPNLVPYRLIESLEPIWDAAS